MSREFCSVVGGTCKAPPGMSTGMGTMKSPDSKKVSTKCYVCGEHVCSECSRFIVMGRGKNCRVCFTCRPKKVLLRGPAETP